MNDVSISNINVPFESNRSLLPEIRNATHTRYMNKIENVPNRQSASSEMTDRNMQD
jgi:hypothetical protein